MRRLTPDKIRGCALPDKSRRINRGNTDKALHEDVNETDFSAGLDRMARKRDFLTEVSEPDSSSEGDIS